MSKNMIRNLIIIVSVLAVVAVAVLVGIPMVERYQAAQKQAAAELEAAAAAEDLAKRTLSSRTTSDIDTITSLRYGEELVFTRDPQMLDWVLVGHEELDLVQSVMTDLAAYMASTVGSQLINEDGSNLAEYGLDDPRMQFTVKFKDGESITYLVGSQAPDGKGYYVKRSDDPRVVRVSDTIGKSYMITLERLHPVPLFNVDTSNIKSIQVWKDGEQLLGLRDFESGNEATLLSWKIDYPFVTDVDGEKLTEYVESISGISIAETIDLSPKDLAVYGLDKPARTLHYTTSDGQDITLHVGIENEETNGYSYVKVDGDPVVYSAMTASFYFMDTTPFSLVSRLLALVNVANVDQFTLNGINETVTVDIEHTPITEQDGTVRVDALGRVVNDQTYYVDGKQLEGKTGVTFYSQIITVMVHNEVEEGWQPTGAPVGSIEFVLNDRVEASDALVEFYEYNTDYYALRVNGGDVSFTVLKETLSNMEDMVGKLFTGELAAGALVNLTENASGDAE